MKLKSWFPKLGRSSTSNYKGGQKSGPLKIAFGRAKKPTLDQALQLSSFWAAVTRWTQTLSSLPVKVQNFDGNSWVEDTESPLNKLFAGKVNRYQTRTEFFKEMVFNLMTSGNAYAAIDRNSRGEIVSLLPLSATQMEVRVLDDGQKVFAYEQNGKKVVIGATKIWHIMLFGNNVVGMSPMAHGANAIGVGLSADERATQVLDNASKPSGILTFDSELTLSDKQRAQLKKEFAALKEGKENVLMTLESGWGYQQIGLAPQDIQLLESRRFTIEDVGRFMDVPSILLNDSTSSTGWGSGITEILGGWYKLSLRPMANYIGESMKVHLIPPGKRSKSRIVFDFDELLQLSRKERVEANQKEINSGTMTPNEGRLSEGRVPKKGADELLINTALQPIDQYLQELANARGENNEI